MSQKYNTIPAQSSVGVNCMQTRLSESACIQLISMCNHILNSIDSSIALMVKLGVDLCNLIHI